MSQNDILNLLHQREELTSKEIIQELKLAKNTISKELSLLRKKKLIKFKKEKGKNQLIICKEENN